DRDRERLAPVGLELAAAPLPDRAQAPDALVAHGHGLRPPAVPRLGHDHLGDVAVGQVVRARGVEEPHPLGPGTTGRAGDGLVARTGQLEVVRGHRAPGGPRRVVAAHSPPAASHSAPSASVASVTGRPALRYVQKPSSMPRRLAPSATIRFATEATSVRLPASVLAIASVRARLGEPSQAFAAAGTVSAKPVAGSSIRTAGTLLTTVDRRVVTAAVSPTTSRAEPARGSHASSQRCGRPVSAIAPTTTNRAANSTTSP